MSPGSLELGTRGRNYAWSGRDGDWASKDFRQSIHPLLPSSLTNYVNHGLMGRNYERLGLHQALATYRGNGIQPKKPGSCMIIQASIRFKGTLTLEGKWHGGNLSIRFHVACELDTTN